MTHKGVKKYTNHPFERYVVLTMVKIFQPFICLMMNTPMIVFVKLRNYKLFEKALRKLELIFDMVEKRRHFYLKIILTNLIENIKKRFTLGAPSVSPYFALNYAALSTTFEDTFVSEKSAIRSLYNHQIYKS
ncbi:hypothetical protein HZS_5728 [Henneguya salminicola]|nr:hypothetical protein HZS_5728 [Henneguya salminicola]